MKLRRQRGATLGLVAACVFLVIIVGVGFYFLSKIIGGGREVANATDAGALNVAKQALRRGAVALNDSTIYNQGIDLTAEFGGLSDPPNSGTIDLITFNRLVAQALLVAKNAEAMSSPAAESNAVKLASVVKDIGSKLRANLADDTKSSFGDLKNDFNSLSNQNNTKMWNGNKATISKLQAGYMKEGGSTNVYIPNEVTAQWSSSISNLANTANQSSKIDPSSKYIAGYIPFTVKLGNSTVELMGVPVLPQTKTHLADNNKFTTNNPSANAIAAAIPPNSWKTDSQAIDAKSGALGGATACAIVGVIDKEFQANIPRGFVRILNNASAEKVNGQPQGIPVSDGANDIFNNELFTPTSPGIFSSSNGVFTTNVSELNAWSSYNQTTTGASGHQAEWEDETQYPDSAKHGAGDPSIWASKNLKSYLDNPSSHSLRYGPGKGQTPTEAQLLGITSSVKHCDHTMYDDSLSPTDKCVTDLDTWAKNYGRDITGGGSASSAYDGDGLSNVEFMKADLLGKISGRAGGKFCATVGVGLQPSGLKAWKDDKGNNCLPGTPGSGKPYTKGAYGAEVFVNYLVNGSPAELIDQMDNCTKANIYTSITERLQQVDKNIKESDVRAKMASVKLDLGDGDYSLTRNNNGPNVNGKLYLYVENGSLKMGKQLPWSDSAHNAPDGATTNGTGGAKNCQLSYPLNHYAVNTEKGAGGAPIGDGGYHEVPFTQADNPGIKGTDSAVWQPGSGFNNLLGELRFEQEVEGTRFCRPN